MIVEKIYKYLSGKERRVDESILDEVARNARESFKRQFMEPESNDKGTIRLSSAGRCARQTAYSYHGYEKKGKELDTRAKVVFWMGDQVEMMIVNLARLSGCVIENTGQNQLSVNFPLPGYWKIAKGHPDGIVIHEGKKYLLEVKSMSSFSYAKFEQGEIDDGYLAQINAYMTALGDVNYCVFIGVNKDSGVAHEMILSIDNKIVEKITKNLLLVSTASGEDLPPPPPELEANDKGFYPWNCLYCAYWMRCRVGAKRVLVGKSYKLIKGDRAKEYDPIERTKKLFGELTNVKTGRTYKVKGYNEHDNSKD